jgi:hypothetical protein
MRLQQKFSSIRIVVTASKEWPTPLLLAPYSKQLAPYSGRTHNLPTSRLWTTQASYCRVSSSPAARPQLACGGAHQVGGPLPYYTTLLLYYSSPPYSALLSRFRAATASTSRAAASATILLPYYTSIFHPPEPPPRGHRLHLARRGFR